MNDPRFEENMGRTPERRHPDAPRNARRMVDARRLADAMAEAEALREEVTRLRRKLRDIEAARPDQEVYERSPFAYVCLDGVGRIVHANPAAAALFGVDRARIVGRLLTGYFGTESRNRFLLHLHACRHATHANEFELCVETPDGEVRVDAVSRVEGGDRLCYHTVMLPSSARESAGANTRSELARAVRYLEAQQAQLALQNRRLRLTQQLLEESRDRYALLYEFSAVGYLSLDGDGYIQGLNLTAALMLAADRLDVIGKSLERFLDADCVDRFRTHLGACRAGAPQVKSELKLNAGAGARDVELISVRPGEGEGERALYHTALTDITDRKHAIAALRESEAKLRWLIDHMPAVLWILNEDGGPRYVSANVVHLLGYSEHEVRAGGARFWLSNIHPDDRERVQTAYARMFAGGAVTGPATYDIEYRRQAKDGSWVWVVDRGMSISEEHGERHATGMLWDTTRRKRMQEQLRESEERFRQLAENIDDVFFLSDVDGDRIFYVSPAFERLWGFSSETLYAEPRSWWTHMHEADRGRVRRALSARKRGAPYDIEFRIRRPDGTTRWIRMRGFPIFDTEGHVYRFAGIAADVTARRKAADTLQQSHQRMRELAVHLQAVREEERKRIAREIHDDLGALLLAIKMDLEATRKALRSGRSDTGGNMEDAITRVDMAIESVRRIATDLRPSILDQLGVIAAVEWQAQDVERRTGIKCEFQSGKDELELDSERATAVFRIVQEALANVVRHSGATRVKIALHESGGGIELRISDNGKGLDADRAGDLHKWGLIGMAERVASFRGRFEVMPAQPRGTTVSVWIPTGTPALPATAPGQRL